MHRAISAFHLTDAPLAFLLHGPLMVRVANICTEPFDVFGHVRLDLAIPQICKPVAVSVANVVVFEARLFDGLEEMDGLHDLDQLRCILGSSHISIRVTEALGDLGGQHTHPGHR